MFNHFLARCEKLKKMNPHQRYDLVNNKRLCRNCLSSKHMTDKCSSQRNCMLCSKRHHTLLHNPSFETRPLNRTESQGRSNNSSSLPNAGLACESSAAHSSASTCSAISQVQTDVLLATALITVYTKTGEEVLARALLDNGSQVFFVTESLVRRLGTDISDRNMQITSISHKITNVQKMANLNIFSTLPHKKSFTVSCIILERITSNLPHTTIDTRILDIPSEFVLADPKFYQSGPIDLLIGMDLYSELLCGGMKKLGKGLPILLNTYLGWTISGVVPCKLQRVVNAHCAIENVNLNEPSSSVSLHVGKSAAEDNIETLL